MKSVLVVDDDPEILTVTAEAFACLGYDVLSAPSGEEALQILNERADVGLVLVDIQMPGLTGLEVVALAARDERLKSIAFVLMTAAFNIGVPRDVVLLRKPFSLMDLLSIADEHLGASRKNGSTGGCTSMPCEDGSEHRGWAANVCEVKSGARSA